MNTTALKNSAAEQEPLAPDDMEIKLKFEMLTEENKEKFIDFVAALKASQYIL